MNKQMSLPLRHDVRDGRRAAIKDNKECSAGRGSNPLDADDEPLSTRHVENVYENEGDHGLYVDMNSPHLGTYVTSGRPTATTSMTDNADVENIYEEIDCRKLPALPAPPSECKRTKPPRPKPPKQVKKSDGKAAPPGSLALPCQEEVDNNRRSRSPLSADDGNMQHPNHVVNSISTCCHCDHPTLRLTNRSSSSPSNSHDIDDHSTTTVLVRSLSVLRRGDHVAWKRPVGLWHHAIVLDVDALSGELDIIHYSGGVMRDDESGGSFASVRRERVSVSVRNKDFYRVDYDPRLIHCFSPDVVVERAMSRLHESEYNPLTRNCEHFARWCKTGQWKSIQVEHMPRRIRAAADKFVHRIGNEGPIAMAKSTVARISLKPAITAAEYKALKSAHEILAHVTPNVERITKSAIDREESWTGRLGHELQRINNVYNTVTGSEPIKTDERSEDNQT